MSDFTFLPKELCSGENKLYIFEIRGAEAEITDLALLLGAYVPDDYIDNDSSLEGRTGYYWTKSDDGCGNASVVLYDGDCYYSPVQKRIGGARPALPFSSISSIPTNGESGKRAKDGVLEVEYGYYPQKAVSRDMQEILERAYKSKNISKTGNSYTTDSRRYNAYNEKFAPKQHEEYEYNGKRYVRVEANRGFGSNTFTLSNGENYRDGDNVWVEVSPVKWLVDERAKVMVTDKLIFSGVPFNHTKNYHGDFGGTDIKAFIDNYFAIDLVQSRGMALGGHNGDEAKGIAYSGVSAYKGIDETYKKYSAKVLAKEDGANTKEDL